MADDETPLEQVVAGAVTALTLTVAFGLLALGVPYFWVAFPVGFGGVLPMALGVARLYQQRQADADPPDDTEDDAIATLRDRYARGELTDDEFEQQVTKLLETEDVDSSRVTDTTFDGTETARERESE